MYWPPDIPRPPTTYVTYLIEPAGTGRALRCYYSYDGNSFMQSLREKIVAAHGGLPAEKFMTDIVNPRIRPRGQFGVIKDDDTDKVKSEKVNDFVKNMCTVSVCTPLKYTPTQTHGHSAAAGGRKTDALEGER